MKKLILFLLISICFGEMLKGQVQLSVSQPKEVNGDWVVDISLDNRDLLVTSLQFDLTIPPEFSYVMGNYQFSPRAQVDKRGKMTDTHSMVSNGVENGGTIRAIIYSNDNLTFSGNSGVIVSLFLSGKSMTNPSQCNLTNIVVAAEDKNGNIVPTPVYPQAQINNENLTCYDCMDDDALVIGRLSDAQQSELIAMLSTNVNVKLVDLSKCPNESLGLLPLFNRDAIIICSHQGQVDNTDGVIYKDGDIYVCQMLKLFDSAKYYLLPVDVTASTVQYTRDFTHLGWNALYLPVEIPVSSLMQDYDIAEIRNMETDDECVYIRIGYVSQGSLSANTPYLIRAHSTGERVLQWSNVNVKHAEELVFSFDLDDAVYSFIGNYSKNCDLYDNGGYAMGNGSLHPALNAETMLGAFRWYMKIEELISNASSKRLEISLDRETSGIEQLQSVYSSTAKYDLYGRRILQSVGLPFIATNKKVIISK